VSNNTKGPKQDSQSQPRSPMPEGGNYFVGVICLVLSREMVICNKINNIHQIQPIYVKVSQGHLCLKEENLRIRKV
jgi:hypothetical protein